MGGGWGGVGGGSGGECLLAQVLVSSGVRGGGQGEAAPSSGHRDRAGRLLVEVDIGAAEK